MQVGAPNRNGVWLGLGGDADALVQALQALRSRVQQAHAADPSLFIHLCDEHVWQAQLQQLRQRLDDPDAGTAAGLQRHPLLGVPFAVKDNIDIAGAPTTAACPVFSHVATANATVVQKLLDAGAVWVAKTNLDQFATGLVGTRSPFGRPASVADAARVSGGSSSGSAVAVAMGLLPFALGTDTAGSGRVPAAFNGIVGLKPTPGRIGTTGVLPACRTLDCVSIFATTVADAAQVLAVLEGPDALDDYSRFEPGPLRLAAHGGPLRIGVPTQPRLDVALGYPEAWRVALQAAASRGGHRLVEIDFEPLAAVGALVYEGPWVAERHAAIRHLFDSQPDALDATVHRVIAKAAAHSATDAFDAGYRLRAMQKQLAGLWRDIDVLLLPTAPTHPTFDAVDADPVGVNAQLGHYTTPVNLLGWCALSVPAGTTAAGLPFGVTWVARGGYDAALVELLAEPETSAQAALQPELRPAVQPTLKLAVVGAHLSGLPLNRQLTTRGALLVEATTTAARYRLHALPDTQPPKPGLIRCCDNEPGAAIAVEVWALPMPEVGSFLSEIAAPLGLGSIELAGGTWVQGFLCEAHALQGAEDISAHGGWRTWLASRDSETTRSRAPA